MQWLGERCIWSARRDLSLETLWEFLSKWAYSSSNATRKSEGSREREPEFNYHAWIREEASLQ